MREIRLGEIFNNQDPTREYTPRLYMKSNFTPVPLQNHLGIEERLGYFEKSMEKSIPIKPGQAQT